MTAAVMGSAISRYRDMLNRCGLSLLVGLRVALGVVDDFVAVGLVLQEVVAPVETTQVSTTEFIVVPRYRVCVVVSFEVRLSVRSIDFGGGAEGNSGCFKFIPNIP